jgi:hypothetical protein
MAKTRARSNPQLNLAFARLTDSLVVALILAIML